MKKLFAPLTEKELAEVLASLEAYRREDHPAHRLWRRTAGLFLVVVGLLAIFSAFSR